QPARRARPGRPRPRPRHPSGGVRRRLERGDRAARRARGRRVTADPRPASPSDLFSMNEPFEHPRPVPPPAEAAPVLRDPLPSARPILLDGVLERQRFHPLLMAALVFFGGFLVYQIAGGVA